MSNVFESSHPLVDHKLTKLRDINTSPKKFRELVREISRCSLTKQPKT